MPTTLSCVRGHQWQVSPGDASAATGARCPICGSQAETALPVRARPGDGLVGDSTAVLPANWKPLPPLSAHERPELPDFEILGELGRGGMGIVFKARQISADRIVALKVIRKDRLVHEEAVRRFRREAQAAARLAHPNIVMVYDSDQAGDVHYLVMEYVNGVTLEKLVEQQGPLPIAEACDYIRQAALGLQHAHEQALVHRDIKPANLMVTWLAGLFGQGEARSDKSPGLLKLLDMGVARLYQLGPSAVESLSTLTQGGAVIGTADYIAPEQLEDPHGADIRADLYSLGCTFYFVLTGQVPFPGGSLVQKLDKQRWEVPPAVNQLRAEVPAGVVAVVRRLMAKRPTDRFRSPGELVAALDEVARTGGSSGLETALRREVRSFHGHTDAVCTVAWCPDGRRALSGSKDRTIRLWDVETGAELNRFTHHNQEVRTLAFSPDGRQVVSASGIGVRLWELASGHELVRFMGHTGAVKAVAFTPGGRVLSAADDRTVRIWDPHTGREFGRFAHHTAAVTSLVVSADGDRALTGSRDQTVRLWEVPSGKELHCFRTGRGMVLGVDLSPDGRFAVSAHFDTVLRLWEVATGRELRRFQGHKQMVTAALFTHGGRHVVSGSQDRTIRLWDLDSGCEQCVFQGHTGGVNTLSLDAQGRRLLSSSADHTVRLWELPA